MKHFLHEVFCLSLFLICLVLPLNYNYLLKKICSKKNIDTLDLLTLFDIVKFVLVNITGYVVLRNLKQISIASIIIMMISHIFPTLRTLWKIKGKSKIVILVKIMIPSKKKVN